jgi:enoyl-CoA hydratase
VPPAELLNKTIAVLTIINSKAPLAVGHCITAANCVFDEKKDGFTTEITLFGESFATEDMKEGTAAFLEKRKAYFSGR